MANRLARPNHPITARALYLGMTLEELCRRVGITSRMMRYYQAGTYQVPPDKMVLLCQELNCEPEELVQVPSLVGMNGR